MPKWNFIPDDSADYTARFTNFTIKLIYDILVSVSAVEKEHARLRLNVVKLRELAELSRSFVEVLSRMETHVLILKYVHQSYKMCNWNRDRIFAIIHSSSVDGGSTLCNIPDTLYSHPLTKNSFTEILISYAYILCRKLRFWIYTQISCTTFFIYLG